MDSKSQRFVRVVISSLLENVRAYLPLGGPLPFGISAWNGSIEPDSGEAYSG